MKQSLEAQLWAIVKEYTRQVADLMEVNVKDAHWIGTNDDGRGVVGVCDFGGVTFFDLEDMQVVIDRLPVWVKRYGSKAAVRKEVEEWMNWICDEDNLVDGHPRISLEHWLMGCPRDTIKIETREEK